MISSELKLLFLLTVTHDLHSSMITVASKVKSIGVSFGKTDGFHSRGRIAEASKHRSVAFRLISYGFLSRGSDHGSIGA